MYAAARLTVPIGSRTTVSNALSAPLIIEPRGELKTSATAGTTFLVKVLPIAAPIRLEVKKSVRAPTKSYAPSGLVKVSNKSLNWSSVILGVLAKSKATEPIGKPKT